MPYILTTRFKTKTKPVEVNNILNNIVKSRKGKIIEEKNNSIKASFGNVFFAKLFGIILLSQFKFFQLPTLLTVTTSSIDDDSYIDITLNDNLGVIVRDKFAELEYEKYFNCFAISIQHLLGGSQDGEHIAITNTNRHGKRLPVVAFLIFFYYLLNIVGLIVFLAMNVTHIFSSEQINTIFKISSKIKIISIISTFVSFGGALAIVNLKKISILYFLIALLLELIVLILLLDISDKKFVAILFDPAYDVSIAFLSLFYSLFLNGKKSLT